MQQPPERPFVPRQTPTKAQPAIGSADFTVSPPFVPGADRERMEALRLEYASDTRTAPAASLPPIEKFLDLSTPNSAAAVAADEDALEEASVEEDELPPVEHFIDPLPAVEEAGRTTQSRIAGRVARVRVFHLGNLSSDHSAVTAAAGDWPYIASICCR